MRNYNKQKLSKLLTGKNFLLAVLFLVFYSSVKKIVLVIKSFITGISDFFISPEEQKKREELQAWLDKLESTINYSNLLADNHGYVATTLYEFFDHLGTSNTDIIYDTFMREDESTVDDLKLIIVKYGIKTTHLFFFDDVTGTLVDHVQSELSGSNLNEIMTRLNDLQIL